jgi:FkbM family methyltransferase
MNIEGVIHVGAHRGEELPNYLQMGIKKIVLFEPLQENCNFILSLPFFNNQNITLYQTALGNNVGTTKMHLSDNNLESSSILEPKLHLQQHDWVHFYGIEEVKIDKLDNFNIQECNFLNVDVQGYELEVLKGSINTLKNIKYVYCEVNRAELYKNNCLIEEIDLFLRDYSFVRVETQWYPNADWGDALYIKHIV